MSTSKKIDEIINIIEANKEILSTMPQNNKKNNEKYLEKVCDLIKEYKGYKEEILKIFKERNDKEKKIEKDKEIDTLKSRMETIENVLFLLSDEKRSYQKMELDKNIFKLSRFYKENLENVNSQIFKCLHAFSNVGIDLSIDDFKYSSYVTEYMETFFEEYHNENSNSEKLKNKFEEIYWKCPDIIIHIELNFRNLYLEKESIIDKFFEKEKVELLRKWQKTPQGIRNTYLNLKKQRIQRIKFDKKTYMDKFMNGKLNTKNYTKDKIKSNCSKVLRKEKIADIENDEEVKENINKFINSLYEYRNYLNFKYLVDEVRKLYNEKDKYKKAYDDTKKNIEASEKKLKKINDKLNGKGLFGKKKENQKQTVEQNNLILEIKELYKNLDLNDFYQKMVEVLNDNSTIYDMLNLASSYYNFLITCMINNNNEIKKEEMDEEISKLIDFINSPYNTIINNITILEDKDIAMIIKDRYKLLDFIVEKPDLDESVLDSLIITLEEIQLGVNLKNIGIDIDTVNTLLNLKKIIRTK